MTYQQQPYPFLDESGYALAGKVNEADTFAKAEHERYLDSLSPAEGEQAVGQHRNFTDHMEITV